MENCVVEVIFHCIAQDKFDPFEEKLPGNTGFNISVPLLIALHFSLHSLFIEQT